VVRKMIVLNFPPRLINEPVTYKLIKDFDLQVNILRATVRPRERGRMVVELRGEKENVERGIEFLEECGVQVDALVQQMRHYPERCIHCSACTAHCPTGALSVDMATREVSFDPGKCILCESCIPACSYQAIESQF